MKLIELHGTPLASFSGVGEVRFTDNNVLTETKGYFEAAQFPSGRLVVAFVPTDLIRPSDTGAVDPSENGLSFSGDDFRGWFIESEKEVLYPRISWLFALLHGHPSELSFHPLLLRAKSKGAPESHYSRVQFLISNFLWHGRFSSGPEPESLYFKAGDFSVAVEPVDDYLNVATRLTGTKGVEPTALVTVEVIGTIPVPLDRFTELADLLVYLFRLITGNVVNWYYGNALDDISGRILEGVYKFAVTAPYSRTVVFSPLRTVWLWNERSFVSKVDFARLAEAFFTPRDAGLDGPTLKSLIDQFTSACNDVEYMEMRGLMASSLTEFLVAKYSEMREFSEVVPRRDFNRNLLPVLQSGIGDLDLPEEFQEHVLQYIRGAYRRSFYPRLERVASELDLPLEAKDCRWIVKTRNSLVHRGTYASNSEDGGWTRDYMLITWTNFSILCRLHGYEGFLPDRRPDGPLEI